MLSPLAVVPPLMLVPHMDMLFPHNAWPAIDFSRVAAAAHQGWSANLFSTPADMFPSTAFRTVVGIGGAAGAGGGALFTWFVKHYLSLHPLIIFVSAALPLPISLASSKCWCRALARPASRRFLSSVT